MSSGCDQRDVGAAIAAKLGIAVSRLKPRKPTATNGHRVIVQTYDYHNAQGALVSQTVRYDPKDFRQRRPNGQGGWIWNLKDLSLVLYRLPEVLTKVAAGETIYIAEGEKSVDLLWQHGLPATCSPLGAGKWKKVDQTPLHGATVVLLPDNDDAGQKQAMAVKKALHGHAARVTILRLPGLPDKGDVYDWFETAGNTTETFLQLVTAAQEAPSTLALSWRDALLLNRQEEPTANVLNVGLILAHHPHWRQASGQSVFWWDAVRGLAMVTQDGTHVPLSDTLTMEVAQWLGRHERLAISHVRLVEQCIAAQCHQQSRDLLQEWLTALPPWDQKPRLETWLHTVADGNSRTRGIGQGLGGAATETTHLLPGGIPHHSLVHGRSGARSRLLISLCGHL